MKVRIVSTDSLTGAEDSFDADLLHVSGESVRDAIEARLSAEDPDAGCAPHKVEAWVSCGHESAFILSCEEFSRILVVGIVYPC